MKVKEIHNLCKLDAGWEPFGNLIIGHDYAQAMVKHQAVKTIEIVVGNNEEIAINVDEALKEGAKLCGAPFAVGNYLCQGLVRIE
jgi:hypothetical protein